jgi:glycerol-3-phosphate acyltransferase PlsY
MTLVLALAYLIGSVPFAVIMARRWGAADLRRVGSGNVGAANVFRASGAKAGLLVASLDIVKGAASVALAERLTGDVTVSAAAACAAVVGHVFPVWLGFRGGKGVATAWGAFSVLTPIAASLAFVVFALSIWITRYVSLGSILASAALPSLAYATSSPRPIVMAALATASLIVLRHRTNLGRLWLGTERRLFTAESLE